MITHTNRTKALQTHDKRKTNRSIKNQDVWTDARVDEWVIPNEIVKETANDWKLMLLFLNPRRRYPYLNQPGRYEYAAPTCPPPPPPPRFPSLSWNLIYFFSSLIYFLPRNPTSDPLIWAGVHIGRRGRATDTPDTFWYTSEKSLLPSR